MNGDQRVTIEDLTKWFAPEVLVYLCVLSPDVDRMLEQKGMMKLCPEEIAQIHNQLQALDWRGTIDRVLEEIKTRREKDHLGLL